jgi:phenylpropionate dioxygenase-like ring-hydroxylating dioxygenase large terminal subunit
VDRAERELLVVDLIRFGVRPRALSSLDDIVADEIDQILADGATLPNIFYTSRELAALEDELVFRPAWQVVGVEPELRRAGDYFTTEIAGFDFSVPVVVVKDEDGLLRAFVNVCRHRAHFVAVGNGNKRSFQCTYHGWVYGLNGCLRSVPRANEGGLPPFEELGLYPLPLETWKGYIFVTLRETEPLAAALGELPAVLEREGFDFPFAPENVDPDLEYTRDVHENSGPSNWKTMNENNIECYHCPTTHRHSFSDMYKVDPSHYAHREFDRGVYHTTDFQDSVAERLGIERDGGPKEYQFYYLWPNMYFDGGLGIGGYGGSFARLWPDGVDAWRGETVHVTTPHRHPVSAEGAAQLHEWWRLTLEEDRVAAGRVQRGLKSGMYGWGYTLPESERNMRHFYRLVWNALAPAFRS